MVVVRGECVAEFEFVFPANRQPLDNTQGFKELERAVDASAVGGVTHGFGDFTDALRFPIEQRHEHGFT